MRDVMLDVIARLERIEKYVSKVQERETVAATEKTKWGDRLWGLFKSVISVLLAAALLWAAQMVQCVPPPANTQKVEVRPT